LVAALCARGAQGSGAQRLGAPGGRISISVWCPAERDLSTGLFPGTRFEMKPESMPTGKGARLQPARKKKRFFRQWEILPLTSGGLIRVRRHPIPSCGRTMQGTTAPRPLPDTATSPERAVAACPVVVPQRAQRRML